jgi:hypothetical protein
MAVAARTEGAFAAGAATPLFKTTIPVEGVRPPSITVVLSWPPLLAR